MEHISGGELDNLLQAVEDRMLKLPDVDVESLKFTYEGARRLLPFNMTV